MDRPTGLLGWRAGLKSVMGDGPLYDAARGSGMLETSESSGDWLVEGRFRHQHVKYSTRFWRLIVSVHPP